MLTRTNAQLAVVQAAMDKARVPSLVAGADLGPASDLRGDGRAARRRLGPTTEPRREATRTTGTAWC